MVREDLPTFARNRFPSYVGHYTSTMEHMGDMEIHALAQQDTTDGV